MHIMASGGGNPLLEFFEGVGANGKILGQGQPGSTPTAIYTLPANKVATVLNVLVCNTDTIAHTFRIFVSASATYNASTALFYDVPIDTKETKLLEMYIPLAVANSAIAAESDSAAVTFTVTGTEM